MKYFSMFSGIGGFEKGIEQAYENNQVDNRELRQRARLQSEWDSSDTESKQGGNEQSQPTCIGYSEIDKYAIQIYERHFNHTNYGDATKIDARELPDFDLLVGGFPCQAFSIAGKRGGLDDARGTLFYDIARIAKEKRPQHLLLENVKGLLSHDNGRTFKLIISTFAELGYNLEWQVLNSKNFGVPQNRERVFIIGHLGRCCGRQVFPIGQNDGKADELQRHIANTLTARYEGAQATGTYVGESKQHAQKINVVGTLDEGTWAARNESIRRVYGTDGLAPTIPTGTGGGVMPKISTEMRIRRLTPTECERLQGYPDGWTNFVSDSQRYKTLGNSISVPVVQYLVEKLYL